MIDLRSRVRTALEKAHLMSLATRDADGLWVADLIFVYDECLNIYWMSSTETRHSCAIAQNSEVAGTITVSVKSKEPNLGIQFAGKAERMEGLQLGLLRKHLQKRGTPEPKDIALVLKGRSWYMIKPTTIHLIDEENFGFKKQIL